MTKTGAIDVDGPRDWSGDETKGLKQDDRTVRHFTVHHDGVAIPVSRGGRGRPLILCPGLNSTQADLHTLIELLRHDNDVMTFDLRGHGRTSATDRYSFEAFLGDLVAVMAESRRLDLSSAPVLVGYSLGADLAVHYASERPETVAELVLIDGANPVPERFITEADLPDFRAMWEGLATQQEAKRGTAGQVLLTGRDILEVNLEVDAVRSGILDRYRQIDQPITMIMSTSMAGASGDERALRLNLNWRAGVDRLARARPHVSTFWLDADHGLVFSHAEHIAQIIRGERRSAD
ncbi:alpha/beta fold hydrolase [Cryptosporangium minutisporangium]|uniref:AB hydrolase-1 domain-containing protein n=1 Tax=Cryptosporangium minutisporangium TaxID=113569 RepID=A0ABP6SYM4_9ACTN